MLVWQQTSKLRVISVMQPSQCSSCQGEQEKEASETRLDSGTIIMATGRAKASAQSSLYAACTTHRG
jgi:hypothetical protein